MKAYGMARKQWQTEPYRITQKCPEPAVLEEKEVSSNKYMVTRNHMLTLPPYPSKVLLH